MRLAFLAKLALASALAAGCGSSATPGTPAAAAAASPAVAAPAVAAPPVGESGHEAEPAERFSRVTIADLEAKLTAGTVHVFDNNDRETYEAGHIPGARWVSYDSVQASDLPADRAAQLVFYCANEHCSACHTAADAAIALGYTNVSILPAGIQGWRAAGKPTVTGARPA